eukprot:gene44886-60807_t
MRTPSPQATPRPAPCAGCRDGAGLDFAFSMAFQPIVDIGTGHPYAYEALVRGPSGESAASVLAQVSAANRYAFDQQCRVKAIEAAARAGRCGASSRRGKRRRP